MTRAQRAAIWDKHCQSGLPLAEVIERVLAEAEEIGRREGIEIGRKRWLGLDEAERRRIRELGIE